MANFFFRSTFGATKKSLHCKTKRGAAMLLPAQSQREDTVAKGEFAEWMVKHIDCWFSFAKGLYPEIERMEDIILVTGRHLTKLWANIAFDEYRGGIIRRFPEQILLEAPVSWSPLARDRTIWTLHSSDGSVMKNMAHDGKVRRGLPCIMVDHFICIDSGPVYGQMRIYPRIPCHSHPPSIELV